MKRKYYDLIISRRNPIIFKIYNSNIRIPDLVKKLVTASFVSQLPPIARDCASLNAWCRGWARKVRGRVQTRGQLKSRINDRHHLFSPSLHLEPITLFKLFSCKVSLTFNYNTTHFNYDIAYSSFTRALLLQVPALYGH